MFTRVRIYGFQSLGKLDLPLGMITTITGPSDSGKSALIRAVRALSENWRGSDFISQMSDKCAVVLESSEGRLLWEKSKGSASYTFELGSSVAKFPKCMTIPGEIATWLGLLPIKVEGFQDNLHFSTQYDPPFLVSESGQAGISRAIGSLTGFGIFTNASRLSLAECKELEKSMAFLNLELTTEQCKLLSRSDIELVSSMSEILFRDHETLSDQHKLVVEAGEFHILWEELSSQLKSLSKKREYFPLFDFLGVDLSHAVELSKCVITGEGFVTLYREVESRVDLLKESQAVLALTPTLDDLSSLLFLNELVALGDSFLKQVRDVEADLAIQRENFLSVEKKLAEGDELLEGMRSQIEQYCPFTNATVPEGVVYACPIPKVSNSSSE